jgi:hypothetical protein
MCSVVEIFVFLQMGGERERMVLHPLEAGDAHLHYSLAHFDAEKAQCFLAKDRDKLLAVVQASFGTFGPFNKIVRGCFEKELSKKDLLSSTSTPVVGVEIQVD